MNLSPPTRRQPGESIVPMINVVFLLLIFFLMTAEIAPPEPLQVDPPVATSETPAEKDQMLFIDVDGVLAYGDLKGDAVLTALAARDPALPLMIRADQALPAKTLAQFLPRLAQAGLSKVQLISTVQ